MAFMSNDNKLDFCQCCRWFSQMMGQGGMCPNDSGVYIYTSYTQSEHNKRDYRCHGVGCGMIDLVRL